MAYWEVPVQESRLDEAQRGEREARAMGAAAEEAAAAARVQLER